VTEPDPRRERVEAIDDAATSSQDQGADGAATGPPRRSYHTVETLVRARLAAMVGGPRGGIEVALPIALFTLVYVVLDELRPAVVAGIVVAVALLVARLVQRSSTQFVRNGLVGMGVAALVATATGRAEDAFLPGILQSAGWAVVLAVSIVVRRPAAGYLIGAVLGDPTGWRHNRAVVRLGAKLTLVLLVPMIVRVAVQLPLYLAGEVGWLGVSRIALGWPLSLAAFAVGAGILARGNTPLYAEPRSG
jgi:hypothetical protein